MVEKAAPRRLAAPEAEPRLTSGGGNRSRRAERAVAPTPTADQRLLELQAQLDQTQALLERTQAELKVLKRQLISPTLQEREEASKRRRNIAWNNAAIVRTWLGVLTFAVIALVLMAVGVESLIWFTEVSSHGVSATTFPAGVFGLLTSTTSALGIATVGVLGRRARREPLDH
jgi:hypothetical protein